MKNVNQQKINALSSQRAAVPASDAGIILQKHI
jgi:hypothetical protein